MIQPRKRRRVAPTPYLMLLPALAVFCAFVFYPFARTLYLSLFMTNATGVPMKFVGLKNFEWLLNSKQFWNSLRVSLHFALLIGVPTLVIGFTLALLANQRLKGSRMYETLYAVPMAVASAPAAAIWFLIYSSGSGVLNYILGTNTSWLWDKSVAIYSLSAVTVWMNMGVNFIFLLTGLRNVPDDLIESATIDGAGYFRRLFKIVIPMASPQIFFVIFLDIVTSFQSFAQVKLLTQGGPAYSTEILVYNIYRTAFIDNRFERACAMSLILFAIIFVITRVQFAAEKRAVHYQ